ncbi:Na+/H+ antiporter subunit E [Dethiobacter alkaliphilus]|uniref:Cation antiporter n=1 Tax=Dethiobacter alkaliphilus AHT 1 TaxID=555088 RepID=C0GJ31_DETAL|nr:Na+/H+ antiporter subunit E [Dethiobacter alkaliphilus]EEG76664.1 cation antiporter [Dethiobacter alkaliphilus AHT 1]
MYYIRAIIDKKGFLMIVCILLGFWFLMTPSLDAYNVIVGIGCALGVTYFWNTDLFKPGEPMGFKPLQLFKLFYYLVLLVFNIVVANIQVARIVLSRDMPISPGFIVVKTKLTRELTRTLYSNSITLTPGTVTINLKDDRLLVHALTKEAADNVSDWYMQDKLREVEVINE